MTDKNIHKKWMYQGCFFLRWNQHNKSWNYICMIRDIINNCNWWSRLRPWPYIKWFRKHNLWQADINTRRDTDIENYISSVIINDYISFYNIVLLYHINQKENSNAWLVYNNIVIKAFSLFVYEIVIMLSMINSLLKC